MGFIVIEGLDGSGKSTQIGLLLDYLDQQGICHQYLHFPRTGSPVYGELIARFLRGEFGELDRVDPYLVALIYAGDRMDASGMIQKWLDEKSLVVVDRYVHSNIAFQCAKLDEREDREKLAEWIRYLEYSYHRIPAPDLSIFLDVPFDFTSEQLQKGRSGQDRSYLNGKLDIHESDLEFQKRVHEVYRRELASDPQFVGIDCTGPDQQVLEPGKIFERILQKLKEHHII